MHYAKTIVYSTAAVLGMTVSAVAATFSLNTTNGTATTLDGGYSLPLPGAGYAIFDFQDTGSGFGGLQVTPNTRITATYIGSEAGASNGAELEFGGYTFSNLTSSVGDSYTFLNSGAVAYVDLKFFTNNLGGNDYIDNDGGIASDPRLHMAFSDIRNAVGDVTSVYAFFGDGAGDQDYDDMVVRFDIAPVPVPAAGVLLLTGLAGIGAFARRRKQRKA